MDVSILICTWNRAALLEQTIESIFAMDIPTNVIWEIVVVDNNCTDNTSEVVKKFFARPNFRYVFEPTAGQSFARNTAIASSIGKIILWTDDDVQVEKDWLNQMLACHNTLHADVVFGKVKPLWEKKKPNWYSQDFDGRFAILDLGDDIRITTDQSGYGVNHSARREVYDRIGLYRTDFGIRPIPTVATLKSNATAGGGEDSYFFEQAHLHGLRVAYCGPAVVRHVIPVERCQKRFYRQRVWHARHQNLMTFENSKTPRLFGIPRYLSRKLLANLYSYFIAITTGNKPGAFYHELQILSYFGLVDAARIARKTRTGNV